MDKFNTTGPGLRFLTGKSLDQVKWDRCIDQAVNGNICAYSWFLDIMCKGWGGIVAHDYEYIMPVPVSRRFGIDYFLQPRFIQQLGVFGKVPTDEEIIRQFIEVLPKEIKVVDYHFNYLNQMTSGYEMGLRNNLVLKTDKTYEELRMAYSLNLTRNLKKSSGKGFQIVQNNEPEPLIKMFRAEKGSELSFLKDEDYRKLTRVIQACLNRDKAKVWSVFNYEKELCGGIIWLFSHGRAVLYFSAQRKTGSAEGALSWLIDAFIKENAFSSILIDFEGSVNPGLARFYRSFGSVLQPYPHLIINRLSPFLRMLYSFYRKMKKD
jgi:hypothetical protein